MCKDDSANVSLPVSEEELKKWFDTLIDSEAPLVDRAKSLWGLRHASELCALNYLGKFLVGVTSKTSPAANELLQHEAAYCLGQRGDSQALPILRQVLNDEEHSVIVRHEAAEAIAALAGKENVDLDLIEADLRVYASSGLVELAETCQIGLDRIKHIKSLKPEDKNGLPFNGIVDPAHAFDDESFESPQLLNSIIMDDKLPLYRRYRALFTLRNHISKLKKLGDEKSLHDEAALLLSSSLTAPGSALLRHEIAFVLGELSLPITASHLCECVATSTEHPMVRHEAAEALGGVLGNAKFDKNEPIIDKVTQCLEKYLKDPEQVVRESCVLALDVADYISSDRFQYCVVPTS